MKVAIVGGGIGGLAAALAMVRRGIDVAVYEQSEVLAEVGAGVQITPNGSRVLLALGLAEELDRVGTRTRGKRIHLWNTGKTWEFMQLGAAAVDRYGAPYLTFHRADLHDLLRRALAQAAPDALHLGRRFERFEETGGGVTIRFEDGTSVAADVMIGADGVHSRVRQQLFGPDRAKFTGCIAWRGLIPADRLPASVDRAGGGMWLGPVAHVVTYPVRKGALLNFIGMVDRDDWQVESWNAQSTVADVLGDFEGWHPDIRQMVEAIMIPYKWALIVREPLERWTVGRVTLLGDACHSTLPFLSQGANMAIEDAFVLARCLVAHAGDPQSALCTYESARIERTSRIVRSSADQVGRVHAPQLADPATAVAHVDREWERSKVDDRYQWIYGYDAIEVALPA